MLATQDPFTLYENGNESQRNITLMFVLSYLSCFLFCNWVEKFTEKGKEDFILPVYLQPAVAWEVFRGWRTAVGTTVHGGTELATQYRMWAPTPTKPWVRMPKPTKPWVRMLKPWLPRTWLPILKSTNHEYPSSNLPNHKYPFTNIPIQKCPSSNIPSHEYLFSKLPNYEYLNLLNCEYPASNLSNHEYPTHTPIMSSSLCNKSSSNRVFSVRFDPVWMVPEQQLKINLDLCYQFQILDLQNQSDTKSLKPISASDEYFQWVYYSFDKDF